MKLIALCYFVLSLYGCDVGGSTFVHRTHVDGADSLYSKATVEGGVARFECLRSASGQCYYTVFTRDCTATSGRALGSSTGSTSKPIVGCRPELVERFAIAKGDSRQIPGLHSFRLCVSAEDGIPGPDCEVPEPIIAR